MLASMTSRTFFKGLIAEGVAQSIARVRDEDVNGPAELLSCVIKRSTPSIVERSASIVTTLAPRASRFAAASYMRALLDAIATSKLLAAQTLSGALRMRPAALKAQASRFGLGLRACSTAKTKARAMHQQRERTRARSAGWACAFGGKTPEEKPQQTWTTLRLPRYARDLNAMTVNGRK
jgi:hypothetical protein